MDSFRTQKTKPRKMKRVSKKSRVQIILDLFFQAIEVIVVLVTIAKLCYELVITLEDSGVAAIILANRSLAFVVGNAIIISLIANSGLLSNQELDPKCKRNDLYKEFVRESARRDGGILRAEIRSRENQIEVGIEAKPIINKVNEEKQSTTENRVKVSSSEKREEQSIVEHHDITLKMEKQNLTEKRQSMSYQRSQSENLKGSKKSCCGRLKRSETNVSSEIFDSDDELRYKIESFIARERRNQKDE